MTLPANFGAVMGDAGYRYYAFISYPETNSTLRDFAARFQTSLNHELQNHLPKIVVPGENLSSDLVFLAPKSIYKGYKWETVLNASLLGSLAMVALCPPMYADPEEHEWCGRELEGMLELGRQRGLPAGSTPVFIVKLGLLDRTDLPDEIQKCELSGRPVEGLAKTAAYRSCITEAVKHVLRLVDDVSRRGFFTAGDANFRIPATSRFNGPGTPPALPNRSDLMLHDSSKPDPFARAVDDLSNDDRSRAEEFEPINGRIISFYSYKGGVGRSMAVANVGTILATALAGGNQRVLLIDWDLEAPGLYSWFDETTRGGISQRPGLVEYFSELGSQLTRAPDVYGRIRRSPELLDDSVPINQFVTMNVLENLDLMTAGELNGSYRRRAASLDWASFWRAWPSVFRAFKDRLQSRWRYVLIDCRTGFSDVSGVSSSLLSSKLVLLFAPNNQNVGGSVEIARRAANFRRQTDDLHPISIYPLPTRVDEDQPEERRRWRLRYEKAFEKCFREIYHDPSCDLSSYFMDVEIPNIPSFSFGEQLVALAQEEKSLPLRRAYEKFTNKLVNSAFAWQEPCTDAETLLV